MRGVRKGFVRLFGGISLCSLKWGWFSNACKINRWNNFLLRFWRRARCFSGNSTVKSYRLASSNLFNFSSSLLGGIHEWGESSFSILFFFFPPENLKIVLFGVVVENVMNLELYVEIQLFFAWSSFTFSPGLVEDTYTWLLQRLREGVGVIPAV